MKQSLSQNYLITKVTGISVAILCDTMKIKTKHFRFFV